MPDEYVLNMKKSMQTIERDLRSMSNETISELLNQEGRAHDLERALEKPVNGGEGSK